MKKFLSILSLAALTIGLLGSCKKEDPTVTPTKVTKIADYLYEYTAEGYSTEAPSELLSDFGPIPIFGCSAVRNDNFYGRNLDFNINEICEFVVRTKATATRPHASIGVANTCFLNITNDMVAAGLSEEQLKYIPWMTMDGINDAGLVCNINVVNAADIKENPHAHTNEGKPQIMPMQLIRALLDNCGSVEEAKTFIKNHDIMPIPTTWDGHIMVADPKESMIVEFTGEKDNEVKFVVQEQMIMTNFYNHLYKEENFLHDGSSNNFPAHACGMERYDILSKNYASSNSMQGMWNLLKMVRYTQTYDVNVEPFWCSEYYDTPKIPTFDDYPMSYWSKEKVLAEEEPQKEIAAYEEYVKTGKYDEKDGLWFTSHNSTYDIANKALWVTIREKYENVYKFKL